VISIPALYAEGLGCEYVPGHRLPCYFGSVPDISPQSLQENSEQHLKLGNESLLPHSSAVIVHIHLTARRYVIHSSASQAKLSVAAF
jgi:hypothetical protein